MPQTVDSLKDDTIKRIEGFLNGNLEAKQPNIEKVNFAAIKGSVESFTSVMKSLEKFKDARCGIIQHEIDGPVGLSQEEGAISKITVRDARAGNITKPEDIAESWMVVMAAQARGAASLIDMDESGADKASKSKVQEAIAKTFFIYCKEVREIKSPKDRKKLASQFNQEMTIALKKQGVKIGGVDFGTMTEETPKKVTKISEAKINKIMADARDFANLGEDQNHIVSISREIGGRGNLVWASMKVDPLSKEMKDQYMHVKAYKDAGHKGDIRDTPDWFQELSPVQRALTMKYVDQIMDGNHAIPTQLRYLPGLKNAFMDVKGMAKNETITDAYAELHNGTLAHGAGAKDNDIARRVTIANMSHLKELAQGKDLVISVLNSNTIFQKDERNICQMSKAAAKKINETNVGSIEYHQNGVNGFALNPDKSIKKLEKLGNDIYRSEGNQQVEGRSKILSTMCKSGKDRTFGVIMRTAASIFGGDKKEDQKEFIKVMADTGHGEAMAGGAGATRGAFGLKISNMYMRIRDEILGFVKKRLINKISGVNSMGPTKLKGESVYEQQLANVQREWEQPGQAQAKEGDIDSVTQAKRLAVSLEAAGLIASEKSSQVPIRAKSNSGPGLPQH